MKIKLFTTLLVSILLFNCSSNNPEPEIDTNIQYRKGKGTGLAIGVIDFGNEKPMFDNGGLYYHLTGSSEKLLRSELVTISVKSRALSNPELGIENKNRFVYLFVVENKAGNYEFINFYMADGRSYGSTKTFAKKNSKLPFKIKDGESCYLGEIKINQKALFKNSTDPLFSIKDNFDINIKMFKQKYPALYVANIKNQTIKSDLNNSGLFVFE